MGRVIIYGLVLCLAAGVAYLYFERSDSPSPVAVGIPGTGSSQASAPQAQPGEQATAAAQGALPKSETPGPAASAGEGGRSSERESISERDRELIKAAAEKFRTGDYEGVIRVCRELPPTVTATHAIVGMSYLKLGDNERAEQHLEEAARHDPSDFHSRKALAFLCYRKDEIDKGLAHAESGLAIKKDPELLALYQKLKNDKRTKEVSQSESTSHFRIAFDGYAHGEISRKVLDILEDAYSGVGKEFDYFPSSPVNVVLYTNRDFYDITRAPGWSSGIYDGKIRIPVRGAEQNEAMLKKVLTHEYTHSVVRSLAPRCPLWINEGLAEYFSHSPKKIGQVIPLDLLQSSFSWLNGEQVGVAYRESYSAVAYLVEKHGFYRMREFLRALSAGNDLEQAFRGSFGQTYAEFLATWGKG
jgi:tetratricopeptide (TPR) repeat protein